MAFLMCFLWPNATQMYGILSFICTFSFLCLVFSIWLLAQSESNTMHLRNNLYNNQLPTHRTYLSLCIVDREAKHTNKNDNILTGSIKIEETVLNQHTLQQHRLTYRFHLYIIINIIIILFCLFYFDCSWASQ